MTAIDLKPARVASSATASSHAESKRILTLAVRTLFPGRIALVSSFGAESAVLLHMLAEIDRSTPVLFLDTGMHFPQTLAYRDTLLEALGLTDVRTIEPAPAAVAAADPGGRLSESAPDLCCALRKVVPLNDALDGFDAWITGRKRFQGGARSALPYCEPDGNRIKVNPLAMWDAAALEAYMVAHDLPRHPLVADGFCSIGCYPCTSRVRPGESAREGRWRGKGKTECGIHGDTRAAAAALAENLDPSI
ncbi:MAG: phosphoadenylyl-sulfate reductase [Pseudomonadota bacterium]